MKYMNYEKYFLPFTFYFQCQIIIKKLLSANTDMVSDILKIPTINANEL